MAKLREMDEKITILRPLLSEDAMGGTLTVSTSDIIRSAKIEWAASPGFRMGREDPGHMGVATVRYDTDTATLQAGQRMEVTSRATGQATSRTYKITSVVPAGERCREWVRLSFSDAK